MDFTNFIPSKDVRAHIRKTGYQLSASEAAYLVWEHPDATLEDRCSAWEEILSTMPDCYPFPAFHRFHHTSIHKFLRSYLAVIHQLLEEFYTERDAIYSFNIGRGLEHPYLAV